MLFYLTLICLCQLFGESLVSALSLPVPGPVIGMALLFVGLLIWGDVPQDLAKVVDGLLSHLSLLFIPAGVGVMVHGHLLGSALVPLTAALVGSTVLTLAVTAGLMAFLSNRGTQDHDAD